MSKSGGLNRDGYIPRGAWLGAEALTTQGFIEANAKVGRGYEAEGYFPDIAAGGQTNAVFLTGATPTILKTRRISFTGPGIKAQIFEAPTYTGGTVDPIYNQSRIPGVAVPTLSQIIAGVTVTDPGTECFAPAYGIGSESVGERKVGSTRVPGSEYHLKQNTAYLLRITNLDLTSEQTWGSYLLWYEGPLSGDVA